MADHDDQRLRNAAAAVLLSGLLGTGVQPKTLTTDDDGQRLRNDAAAAFLSELLGIGIQPETLTADDVPEWTARNRYSAENPDSG